MTELPSVNERVALRVAGSDRDLSSRVEDADERWLVLALPSDGLVTYVLPVGREVTVAWESRRGPAELTGIVAGRAPVRVPAYLIELTAPAAVAQRREHVRAQALLDIELLPLRPDARAQQGTTLDLSGGGALAHVPGGLDDSSRVRLTLRLADGPPIDVVARVVRVAGEDTLALGFELIPPQDRERVVRYVFSRLGQALRVREAK